MNCHPDDYADLMKDEGWWLDKREAEETEAILKEENDREQTRDSTQRRVAREQTQGHRRE